jgi:hypothetical protein
MSGLNVNICVHPLYEPGYVIPWVGNLTEEKSYLVFFFFLFLEWGETESTWYIGH